MKCCCVCNKESSVYKCPTCRQPYCSAACCALHKEKKCQPCRDSTPEVEESAAPERAYDFPTEDTVPPEKLGLLRNSQDVKKCLNNPHVRDIAKAILKDEDPTRAIALAMTEPIFVELADACLRIVEPSDKQLPR